MSTNMIPMTIYREQLFTFSDASILTKLWHSDLPDICPLSRIFRVETDRNPGKFLDLFVIAVWANAIENRKFNLRVG
jgi:hypothetical protein